jgi:nitrate reductase gamma subunit
MLKGTEPLSQSLLLESVYGLLRGPLALASFAVFFLGLLLQILRFMHLSRRSRPVVLPAGVPARQEPFSPGLGGAWRRWRRRLQQTVFGRHPLILAATTLFHICFFGVPLFLMAHNVLLEELTGISLCPFVLSEPATDALSGLFLLCAGFLFIRRVFVRQVRAVTTAGDYLTLGLAVAPFVTGLMALHHTFDYTIFIVLHMLVAEVLLCTLPFTKFVHMLFFFINRLAINSEYSFRAGRRCW